ncbi:hypothetical protein FHY18_000375 [Xanthomonas arboricola]|nr:hypothetical protein [Xanthomonas sp. 3793]
MSLASNSRAQPMLTLQRKKAGIDPGLLRLLQFVV